MKKLLVILLVISMMAGIVACGSSDSSSSSSSSDTSETESDTGSGSEDSDTYKLLRFGESNANVGYDAQTNTNSGAAAVEGFVVEGLYCWDNSNTEIPVLAEDFPEISDDNLVYTFKLREGVYFSNGVELTSADVKYSFERMFRPETAATSTYMYDMIEGANEMLAGEADELSGFEIVDDYTFRITLTEPFSCFTQNLGIIYACIYPAEACEEAGDDWGITTLIGTGPYIFTSADSSKVVLMKNENYWGDQVDDFYNANFDEVNVIFYDDDNTKMMAFENGDIDITQVATSEYLQYQGTETAELFHEYYPLGTIFLSLNVSDEFNGEVNPLGNAQVREAMSMAIDRDTMVESHLNGLGIPATGNINLYELGYVERDPYPYDPEGARELLAEAGYPDGFTFTATIRSQDQSDMVVVQSDLAQIGIDMQLEVVEAGIWTSERNAGNLQALWMGWFPLYADADNNIYSYFHSSNSAGKSCYYNNPEFDALMDAARATTDNDERQRLYEEADEILSREDYASIPLYYPVYTYAAQEYVTGTAVGNLTYQLWYEIDYDMDIYNAQ